MEVLNSRPFREAYSDLFESIPEYEKEVAGKIGLFTQLGKTGQCGIHVIDGRILFISGYFEVAPGVIEGFIYPSKYIFQYRKTFYREVKWWVQTLKVQCRRFQCWGEDTELSRRWLEALGFRCEGVLQSFTSDGSSWLVWGLV